MKVKITKGTIIRTAVLAIVIINMILKQMGMDLINVTDSQVGDFVEMLISVATIIVAWWENNSVSQNAIRADMFLQQLKEIED
ncbi:MAG: SPP1 phage holin family protein [Eubacteriaceae bacterium]